MKIDEHIVKIDLNKVEYKLGMSYHQALDLVIRVHNEQSDIINAMQERITCLELKARV